MFQGSTEPIPRHMYQKRLEMRIKFFFATTK